VSVGSLSAHAGTYVRLVQLGDLDVFHVKLRQAVATDILRHCVHTRAGRGARQRDVTVCVRCTSVRPWFG
jgi:hypothetical protein